MNKQTIFETTTSETAFFWGKIFSPFPNFLQSKTLRPGFCSSHKGPELLLMATPCSGENGPFPATETHQGTITAWNGPL